MTHYNVDYSMLESEEEKIEKAIADIRDYCGSGAKGKKLFETIVFECGRAEENGSSNAFHMLNIALSFAGIQGYPVHALGKRYCPTAYDAWMKDENYK